MKVGEEYVKHDIETGEYHLFRLISESKDGRVTESVFLGKVRYAKISGIGLKLGSYRFGIYSDEISFDQEE